MTYERFRYERFTLIECNGNIEDEYEQNVYDGGEDVYELLDLLNKLEDEKDVLKDSLNFCKENVKRLNDDKKELKNRIIHLEEDLLYYQTKSASCEEGLFQQDREIAKLKKENEQLEKTISHYADISALSVEILNEEEEVINDYARIVCNDAEELIKENEQLKSEIRKQSKQCTASIQRFKEENEQLKQQLADVDRLIYDLGHDEMRRQYEEIFKGDVE